jgi:predicted dehydrogenase
MRKLRIVQIGCFEYVHAFHIARATAELGDLYEIIAFVEESEARRKPFIDSGLFDGVPFLSLDDALNLNPDAVFVETREEELVKYTTIALERGFPVHVDKPGGENIKEFAYMCDLAKEKNLPLSLGYMYRYNPAVLKIKELVKQGKLGELLSVDAHMGVCYTDKTMRLRIADFKGGMTFYLGCHLIDLVTYFLGFPDKVIPLNGVSGAMGVDCVDTGFVALEYKKATSFIRTSAVEVNAFGRRQLTVSGTDGTVLVLPLERPCGNGFDECVYKICLDKSTPYQDNSTTYTSNPYKRYEGLLRAFYGAIVDGIPLEYTPDYEKRLHETVLKACGIE